MARRARVLQTVQSDLRANPQGTLQALNLPPIGGGSTLSSISTGLTAAQLALAPVEIAAEIAAGVNPITAIPFIAFDIAQLLGAIPSFAGKPKLQDTVQGIQRLAQSQNPSIQQLARNLAIFARNGVPLSTSNPAQQAEIRQWIGGTVQTILQQQGLPLSGANVTLLDQAIRNVLSSEVANPGSRIDSAVAQLGGHPVTPVTSQPQPAPSLSLRPIRSPNPGPTVAQPNVPSAERGFGSGQAIQWLISSGLFGGLGTLNAQDAEQLLHCIISFIRHGPVAALACVGDLLARQVEQTAKKFLQDVLQFMRGQPTPATLQGMPQGQPGGTPGGPLPGPQPGIPQQPAPILDQKSDCPECTPKGRQLRSQLRSQESRTLQDIRTEQEQLTEQQLTQQAQQLTQLEQTETQPQTVEQIQKSLQQKQQLLQMEQQEEGQVGGQPGTSYGGGGQPAPTLRPSSAQAAQQEISDELHSSEGQHGVQFCIGCQTMDDAVLFLNGEPSKCSVIPGTTKQLNV